MKSSIEKYNIKEDLNMDSKMILLIIGMILFMTGFAASRLRDKSDNEITTIFGVIFLIGGSIVLILAMWNY